MSKGLVMCVKTIPAVTKAMSANAKLAIKELIQDFQNNNISITESQAIDLINQYRSNQFVIDQCMKNLLSELSKLH